GPVEHFDTIVVEITDRDGRVGLGEATILTGYTDETIDDSWRAARDFAPQLAATGAGRASDPVATLGARYPFTATAFGSALEMLAGSAALEVKVGTDAARDGERVRAVQRVVAGRARIRIDANQGYTASDGLAFVQAL